MFDTAKEIIKEPFIYRDDLTLSLYATDASMYEERPAGVVFPKNGSEIQEIVRWAHANHISITPRSAGTSLAGQATGNGLIMDVSRHMTAILDVDVQKRMAHVQPGVIRDSLNREIAGYNLLFGPDTSTTNRCMMGGMIGNNSAGSFSIKYGSTRDHILEIEAVLSDGSFVVFKPLSNDELEGKKKLATLEGHIYREMLVLIEKNKKDILEAYPHPEIIRRNTGYALDKLCSMQPFNPDGRPFNMAELLCGSEGTLAMTVNAKLNLVPKDKYKILLIPQFNDLDESLRATIEAVTFKPSAVELVDDIILNATKGNIEQRKNRFFLEGEPKCLLIIEFEGNNRDELREKAESLQTMLQNVKLGYTSHIFDKEEDMSRVWDLRKSGLGLLMGLVSDKKSPTFSEDTAVRVVDLPDYVKDFQKILKKYDTNCVFYAHASVGELHLRPVLNIKTEEGIRKMKAMAEEIAGLVHSYKGSLSGEHGDGRARAPYIEKVLGPEMMPLLAQVKQIWDPEGIFNPGKIVHAKSIDTDLRYSPAYQPPEVDTVFKWRNEMGFSGAVEQCNGAGVCRKLSESGGTMCPSYMATKDEKDTTRGRANLFRQLFSGRQKEAFTSDELNEALELCLMCKGCKTECPANVDMARMKSEFLNGRHAVMGTPLSHQFFGQPARFYPLASFFAPLANWFNGTRVGKEIYRELLNIHPERVLPSFTNRTFVDWFEEHKKNRLAAGRPPVLLFVDVFMNYHEPEIGRDVVRLLERMGYHVLITAVSESGRTQISKGLLNEAKKSAHKNISRLYEFAKMEMPVVGIEPSEILTLRDEYLDICDDEYLPKAKVLAEHTFMLEEFLTSDRFNNKEKLARIADGKKQKVLVHGHCHAKSLVGIQSTMQVLKSAGFEPTDLKTGCCGMAGSFGYEENHYEVSMQIGELKLFPGLRSAGEKELICAPGFSCRHQIHDGVQKKAQHPASILAAAVIREQ